MYSVFVSDITRACPFPHGTVRFTRQTHQRMRTRQQSALTRPRDDARACRANGQRKRSSKSSCAPAASFAFRSVTHTHRQKRETHADHHVHIHIRTQLTTRADDTHVYKCAESRVTDHIIGGISASTTSPWAPPPRPAMKTGFGRPLAECSGPPSRSNRR